MAGATKKYKKDVGTGAKTADRLVTFTKKPEDRLGTITSRQFARKEVRNQATMSGPSQPSNRRPKRIVGTGTMSSDAQRRKEITDRQWQSEFDRARRKGR